MDVKNATNTFGVTFRFLRCFQAPVTNFTRSVKLRQAVFSHSAKEFHYVKMHKA